MAIASGRLFLILFFLPALPTQFPKQGHRMGPSVRLGRNQQVLAGHWWLMSVILAAQEAEIRSYRRSKPAQANSLSTCLGEDLSSNFSTAVSPAQKINKYRGGCCMDAEGWSTLPLAMQASLFSFKEQL
jgi:hypothetical protein